MQEQAVESILEVEFGGLGRTELGIGVACEPEDSSQGASELHRFRRGVGDGRVVESGPAPVPRVVAQDPLLSFTFFFDCSRPEHELLQDAHQFVGRHHPELAFDEVRHFLAKEGGVLGCGRVASTADALVFLLVGPGGRVGFGRHPVVPPQTQEVSRWVLAIVESGGQVGGSSEFVHEGLPGVGPFEGLAQLTD